VNEAHVGLGRLDDQVGDSLQDPVQIEAGRDGVDDAGQQPRLALGIVPA
jgi:hypothetical protein